MASEIKVDTISEKTSAGGVTIDGLLIKDGGISGDVSLIGTTPTFTIGDAGAEDATLLFDGNAQDYHVGLDDSSDSLVLGLGSSLGTTPAITINSSQVATFAQAPVFPDGSIAVADLDIDGATDVGAAIVDADLFIMDDGAGGTNRKVTASRIKTYAGGAVTALNNATANELVTVGSTTTELDAESGLTYTDGALVIGGTTPSLTIGDAGAEDTKIVFDGNAQDFHIGLDDSADDLVIGLGSTLGTTSHIICDEAGLVTTPLNASFRVYQSTDTDYSTSATMFNSNVTEAWDTNNDLSSGTFTAPVTGIYMFTVGIYDKNATDDTGYDMGITTSNRGHRIGNRNRFEEGTTGYSNMKIEGVIIADMDANDTAYVFSGATATITNMSNNEHSYFSGVLIG